MLKGSRTIIHHVSSARTGYGTSQEKLQLEKHDPRVREHVLFVEGNP